MPEQFPSQSAQLRFVDARRVREFDEIVPRLRAILWDIARYSLTHFALAPVITHLLRTQEEQERIYGAGTTRRSPHQDGRAADLRSRIYMPSQIRALVAYINEAFPRTDGYATAIYHDIGLGPHLHIQVSPQP